MSTHLNKREIKYNMKKISIGLLLILIVIGRIFAQCIDFTSKITVVYDMYIMFNTFPYYSATLDFNSSEAFFSFQEMGDSPDSQTKSKVIKGGDGGSFVKKINKSISRIYENKESRVLLIYTDKGEKLLIDSIQPIKWKYIENKTKKIANYDCFMAEGYFRGCIYTVWYTPDIPSSFGPWKLNGCPGLILEVTRDDKALSFYATKIVFQEKNITSNIPDGEKETYAQSSHNLSEKINKFFEQQISQRIRGDDHIAPFLMNCLECDFLNDVKRYPQMPITRQVSWGNGDGKEEEFPINPTP